MKSIPTGLGKQSCYKNCTRLAHKELKARRCSACAWYTMTVETSLFMRAEVQIAKDAVQARHVATVQIRHSITSKLCDSYFLPSFRSYAVAKSLSRSSGIFERASSPRQNNDDPTMAPIAYYSPRTCCNRMQCPRGTATIRSGRDSSRHRR